MPQGSRTTWALWPVPVCGQNSLIFANEKIITRLREHKDPIVHVLGKEMGSRMLNKEHENSKLRDAVVISTGTRRLRLLLKHFRNKTSCQLVVESVIIECKMSHIGGQRVWSLDYEMWQELNCCKGRLWLTIDQVVFKHCRVVTGIRVKDKLWIRPSKLSDANGQMQRTSGCATWCSGKEVGVSSAGNWLPES